MEQDQLRKRLIYAIDNVGLRAKQIGKIAGITESTLSRFKNAKTMLCRPEAERLNKYFEQFFMVEL